MEHSEIDASDLIERYVRGDLPPVDRIPFEEHFLDCPKCLEELELARALRAGLKIHAAERQPGSEPNRARWFDWLWRWQPAVVLAAALMIAVIPSAILHRQVAVERQAQMAEPAVYVLAQTRGQESAQLVQIPSSPRWIVLSMELDVSRLRSYRATLREKSGKIVHIAAGLEPASPDAIAVSVPSTILHTGDYWLVLEGEESPGTFVAVAAFPIQATAAR